MASEATAEEAVTPSSSASGPCYDSSDDSTTADAAAGKLFAAWLANIPALVLLGFGQLGTAFGPLIGGALTQSITWRWST